MDSRVEVISTVRRRRRWKAQDKVRLLEEALRPGASVAAIADRHGISRSLLFLWRKQARTGAMAGVAPIMSSECGFAPVVVSPAAIAPGVPGFSRASAGKQGRLGETVEIGLANGRLVRVGIDISPDRLAALLRAIEQ